MAPSAQSTPLSTKIIFSPGDKSQAICPQCSKLAATTMTYCDIPFDDSQALAKGILAAVCDICHSVAAIPAQSTPAIAHAKRMAYLKVSLLPPNPYAPRRTPGRR